MSRGRKAKTVEKNYDELIQKNLDQIEVLTAGIAKSKEKISELKKNNKKLEKEKTAYEEYKVEIERQKKLKEIAQLVASSDKSLDEIKSFLEGNVTEDTEKVTEE